MMRTLRVIPHKPLDELLIEAHYVVRECDAVPVCELFLNRTVEPLDECVHLGCSRIGMEMRNTKLDQLFSEVLREFAPVVGLYATNLKWDNAEELPEEVSGSCA